MRRPLPTSEKTAAMAGDLVDHFGNEELRFILNHELSPAQKASLAQQTDLKNWIREHPQDAFQAVSHSVKKTLTTRVPDFFKNKGKESEQAFLEAFEKLPPSFQVSYLGAYEKYVKAREIKEKLKTWQAEGFGAQSLVAEAWKDIEKVAKAVFAPARAPELKKTGSILTQ